MKYSAKILFRAIGILYILVMVVALGLLLVSGSQSQAPLVNTETVYVMLGLWLAIPVGLVALTMAVIMTVKACSRRMRQVKATAYLAGAFVIGAALVLVVFLIMTMLGMLHPRLTELTLTTLDKFHTYDETPLVGDAPQITYGKLHEGHRLEVRSLPQYTRVGRYPNAPEFQIVDETGEDVTAQYNIVRQFGALQVEPRKITLSSPEKTKPYDGEPLQADAVVLTAGTLVAGHELTAWKGNSITKPGSERILASYTIQSENGDDMTSQYDITEDVGDLTVLPLEITVTTDSANKAYDGKGLTADRWKQTAGTLLEGHRLEVTVTGGVWDVGTATNDATAIVLDKQDQDVSDLYNITYQLGTLRIQPIPLYITTESAQKIYDGTALECPKWELTRGDFPDSYTLEVRSCPSQTQVGTAQNNIEFVIFDNRGKDVTHRYVVVGDYGTLTVQPRAITVRTDSAEKVYDGKPLSCNTFQILSGSLCQGDWIELTATSITNVGYSENYVVDCAVYRKDDEGNVLDVSNSYRITFDYGMLKITEP